MKKTANQHTLTQAIAFKNAQGSDLALSKAVNLGHTYRLFFRLLTLDDGSKDMFILPWPIRSCDRDSINITTFVMPTNDTDEMGKVVDNTGLQVLTRISRVFNECSYRKEIKLAERTEELQAEQEHRTIDITALKAKKEELDVKYHGNPKSTGSDKYSTVPLLVGGIRTMNAAQCLVVPMGDKDVPLWADAKFASVDLASNTKISQLQAILTNSAFVNTHEDYLEVSYSYIGADKKAAGKAAAFTGISPEVSIKNTQSALWTSIGEAKLKQLAESDEMLRARNGTLSRMTTVAEVFANFKKYISKQSGVFAYMDEEDEAAPYQAKTILDANVISKDEAFVIKGLQTLAEKAKTDDEGDQDMQEKVEEAVTDVKVGKASKATTLKELVTAADGDVEAISGSGDVSTL